MSYRFLLLAIFGCGHVMARLSLDPPQLGSVSSGSGLRAHAAERWARSVLLLLDCPYDPRTLEAWGRVVGAGRGTLRAWCRAAGLSAKASLDFARLLRAVALSQGGYWDPQNMLDIVDERTLRRLCDRGGVAGSIPGGAPPSFEVFLSRQRLISHHAALGAVTAALDGRGRRPFVPSGSRSKVAPRPGRGRAPRRMARARQEG